MKRRDTQKNKLYRAQQEVRQYIGTEQISGGTEITAYVQMVLSHNFTRLVYPKAPKSVAIKFDIRQNARYWAMMVPAWVMSANNGHGGWTGTSHLRFPNNYVTTKETILHEIAHSISYAQGTLDGGAHGRNFAKIMLNLVLAFLGAKKHDELVAAFDKNKVKHS